MKPTIEISEVMELHRIKGKIIKGYIQYREKDDPTYLLHNRKYFGHLFRDGGDAKEFISELREFANELEKNL